MSDFNWSQDREKMAEEARNRIPSDGYCCNIFPGILMTFPRVFKYNERESRYTIQDPDGVAYTVIDFCNFCGRKLFKKKNKK